MVANVRADRVGNTSATLPALDLVIHPATVTLARTLAPSPTNAEHTPSALSSA